jgi:hypothetical protein
MVRDCFSYVEVATTLGPKILLKKEIGFPSCIMTAPMSFPLASTSRTKGLLESGNAKTGGVDITSFNFKNACCCCCSSH